MIKKTLVKGKKGYTVIGWKQGDKYKIPQGYSTFKTKKEATKFLKKK